MDPLFDVTDKAILVAGAGGGIGRELARVLGERGARLLLTDVDGARAEAALPDAATAGACEAMAMDITDEASIVTAVDAAVRRFGRLDGVLNAAGVLTIAPAKELSEAAFQATLDINLKGPFLLSRVAAKAMGAGGRIVHLASVSSKVANPNYAAYATSKAGLAQLVRVLAREWASDGITVNAIGPAVIESGMIAPFIRDPESRRHYLSQIPMGRFSSADDLIGMVVLLLSEAGRYITGQTIYVDGGRTLV